MLSLRTSSKYTFIKTPAGASKVVAVERGNAATTFSLFPNLPQDIKNEIWKCATQPDNWISACVFNDSYNNNQSIRGFFLRKISLPTIAVREAANFFRIPDPRHLVERALLKAGLSILTSQPDNQARPYVSFSFQELPETYPNLNLPFVALIKSITTLNIKVENLQASLAWIETSFCEMPALRKLKIFTAMPVVLPPFAPRNIQLFLSSQRGDEQFFTFYADGVSFKSRDQAISQFSQDLALSPDHSVIHDFLNMLNSLASMFQSLDIGVELDVFRH